MFRHDLPYARSFAYTQSTQRVAGMIEVALVAQVAVQLIAIVIFAYIRQVSIFHPAMVVAYRQSLKY